MVALLFDCQGTLQTANGRVLAPFPSRRSSELRGAWADLHRSYHPLATAESIGPKAEPKARYFFLVLRFAFDFFFFAGFVALQPVTAILVLCFSTAPFCATISVGISSGAATVSLTFFVTFDRLAVALDGDFLLDRLGLGRFADVRDRC